MTVDIFPDNEQGRAQLIELGKDLGALLEEKDDRPKSTREDLLRAIDQEKGWQVLQHIDRTPTRPATIDNEIWSSYALDKNERNLFFTFVYNASMISQKQGSPGYTKGHDILLENISQNQRSYFYEHITPEIHAELVNGAFWENLPDLHIWLNNGAAYGKIEKILTQQHNTLDARKTAKGIDSMGGTKKLQTIRITSNGFGLSLRAIRAYGTFIESVDAIAQEIEVSEEDMRNLVRPYDSAIQYESDDHAHKEFPDREELMKGPLILKYAGIESRL